MRAFLKRFRKANNGASALEFALVFPVFMSMMFGTIQMGLAYYTAGSVQYALEKTTRTRMVQVLSASQLQAAFNTEVHKYVNQNISLSYSVTNTNGVNIAQFSATYTHQFIIPMVPSFTVAFPVVTKVPVT